MKTIDSNEISLKVIIEGEVLFESDGKWLYPLFDLEDHLKTHSIPMKNALVQDKVIGKAAALLLVRLGAGRVHGGLMSELGDEVLFQFNLPHSFDQLVPRIECKTETILAEINDPEQAYAILCQRAGRC